MVLLPLARDLLPAARADDQNVVRLLRECLSHRGTQRALLPLAEAADGPALETRGAAGLYLFGQSEPADHARTPHAADAAARDLLLRGRRHAGRQDGLLPLAIPAELQIHAGQPEEHRHPAR